jgi:hypothetical protein
VEENGLMSFRFCCLAVGAIERGTLGLHDAKDRFLLAGNAEFASAVIHPMMILVAAGFVQGVAIGSVGKR